jgi:prolyl-tRNA editing enzyme YbaK/EbsC (Cys-tRNA(Pro) deacylase)
MELEIIMQSNKISSIERVRQQANSLNLLIEISELPDSTRTAEEAATACQCDVAQIVKSMIFERSDNKSLVLILVSGAHNADMGRLKDYFGCKLQRADPKKIREVTGFAIGGISPIGHLTPIPTFVDKTLLGFDIVWAAAGKPNAVFRVAPMDLFQAMGATQIDV